MAKLRFTIEIDEAAFREAATAGWNMRFDEQISSIGLTNLPQKTDIVSAFSGGDITEDDFEVIDAQ